jgi:RNA polymerase sigma-70 factor (ECF subfamily)
MGAFTMNEHVIVKRAQDGDQDALEQVIALYEKRIFNFCYRMVGDREEALDLAQDTFLRVCASLRSFRGDAPFSSWIYRIANNVCVDYIRRRRNRRAVSLDAACETSDGEVYWQVADTAPGPPEMAEYGELVREVKEGIRGLSPDHRAVIVMHDVQNLTYEQISVACRCPMGTVKSRLNRARHALQKHLENRGIMPRTGSFETLRRSPASSRADAAHNRPELLCQLT